MRGAPFRGPRDGSVPPPAGGLSRRASRLHWHALEPDEAVARLGADAARGLAEEEAERRLRRHGVNEIETEEPFSWPAAVARQLLDPLVW